ncbi:hypothetical protein FH972_023398 [Carpinus fangiana]|uniref:RING-type domain-containing protein n=1 Tax=Carpinus fangiana TaxID=176857 RepID=A0A5N6KXC7_9ROSI|nr:hypothetical protein FH972_023398 [Carpinus fangiana]
MSRAQHDQVIEDDEAETCPLCIEDFDLSDRNFRPCPCGYQICQFCYNNIKTTMNGLCPACRRVYDDKNIQWKVPSAEEMASYKENVAQQAKKKAAARQKEAQRREADSLSRKHLAGIRVRQKNLVYVTGMRPTGSPEKLAEELRKPEYFGQYGKIVKVVVSKAKENHVGIYVTFENKDDARRCIESVDGSSNNENRLRAQYGTTKYCSAYLRGETCGNRQCMFLHEPGEENESFTRQDLSSMNVISTQSPQQANMGGQNAGPPLQPQPPPQQAPQYVAAASQANETQTHREGAGSPVDSSDGSALPSTASWAKMRAGGSTGGSSRRASQAQSTGSPFTTNAIPAIQKEDDKADDRPEPVETSTTKSRSPDYQIRQQPSLLNIVREALGSDEFSFSFDESRFSKEDLDAIAAVPLFFDPQGGPRRHIAEKRALESRKQIMEKQSKSQMGLGGGDFDESGDGGSLQLGGEPEDRANMTLEQLRRHQTIQSPTLSTTQAQSPGSSSNIAPGRGVTPQQQQQALLQQFKSASPNFLNQGQGASAPGHARQSSRFSFANDQTASANVKPVANPKLMSQQSSMMPPANQYNSQNSQFFSGSVQGPPPGLKATGTPPVSGGGMFGQGHGFATAGLSYGMNAGNRNVNDEMMRELLRNRGGSAGSAPTSDTGRLDHADPSISRMHQSNYGAQAQGQASGSVPVSVAAHLLQEDLRSISPFRSGVSSPHLSDTRRSTPALPPGLPLPFGRNAISLLESEQAELPSMPELGRVVSVVPASKTENPQLNEVVEAKETPAFATTTVSKIDEAESSFPALPKPSVPKTSAKNTRKARSDSRSSAIDTSHGDKKSDPQSTGPQGAVSKVTHQAPVVPPSEKSKQTHPGKLDISGVLSLSQQNSTPVDVAPGTPVQFARDRSATPSVSSRSGTPSQIETPVKRTSQPRTIRILDTPKTEKAAAVPSFPSIVSRPSRQASIVSTNTPGTPLSETMDGGSATDSMSRANSPPPVATKVGSAPVRSKTKSQQKKERQERAKAIEEREREDIEPSSAAEAVVQEPIMGRKKKTTKAKKAPPLKTATSNVATAASTPVASRPPSPVVRTVDKPKVTEIEEVDSAPSFQENSKVEEQPVAAIIQPEKKVEVVETDASKRQFLSDLYNALAAEGQHEAAAVAGFFKANGNIALGPDLDRGDSSKTPVPAQPSLTPEEMAQLEAGHPVRRSSPSGGIGSRLLITPHTRKALRCLAAGQEDRFLAIEHAVRTTEAPLRYSHRARSDLARHSSYLLEEMFKDAAAALTRPPTTASASAAAKKARAATAQQVKTTRAAHEQYSEATGKPVSAPAQPAYGDDALAYLNQFILPLPSTGRERHYAMPPAAAAESTTPISAAIPRTYTTGDPTYSVSGVDLSAGANGNQAPLTASAASQSSLQAVAAAAMALNASSSASAAERAASATAAAETLAATLGEGGKSVADVRREVLGVAAAISQQAAAQSQAMAQSGAHGSQQAKDFLQQSFLPQMQALWTAGGGHGNYAGLGPRSVHDAELAMNACKKEVDQYEKKLMGLVRRNRKAAGL